MDPRHQALFNWINQETDFSIEHLTMISGDASFRRYFRFSCNDLSYIAVDAPPTHENNEAFINIANAYLAAKINVPEVVAFSLEHGFMVLQDFGDVLFSTAYESEHINTLYKAALEQLPAIQSVTHTAHGTLPSYDDDLLDREFALFNHWLIEVHLKLELERDDWHVIYSAQAFIRNVFKAQPQVGVHRDYHSRNLMLLSEDLSSPQIGVIDFQDAVIGPITYDAVSLLRDCYVAWPNDMVLVLLQDFHQQHYSQIAFAEFKYWFDMVGMQRHIKASGIFCRLCHRDGKRGYLNDIPQTLKYIVQVGSQYEQTKAFANLVQAQILPAIKAGLAN